MIHAQYKCNIIIIIIKTDPLPDFQLVSNLIQVSIEESRFRLVKGNEPSISVLDTNRFVTAFTHLTARKLTSTRPVSGP